jgi:hypothetical protein
LIDPLQPVAKLEVPRVKSYRGRYISAPYSSASDTYTTLIGVRSLKYFFQGEEFSSP